MKKFYWLFVVEDDDGDSGYIDHEGSWTKSPYRWLATLGGALREVGKRIRLHEKIYESTVLKVRMEIV